MNSLYLRREEAELPPIVFIHGASANLYDPVFSTMAGILFRWKNGIRPR
jgi:hypothetical protein